MTAEFSGDITQSLYQCECKIFKALSPANQELNRQFRLKAEEREDVPGLINSLCGGCVKQTLIEKAETQNLKSLLLHKI